MDLFDVKI